MADNTDAKTRAVDIVRQIIADGHGTVDVTDPAAAANVAFLEHAVEVDLLAADHKQIDLQDIKGRLEKVEAQAHVLSDAVVAIADLGSAVAPAIKAVKDEM